VTAHRTGVIVAASALAFLLLATGALYAGAAVGSRTTVTDSNGETIVDSARPKPAEVAEASRLRTCTVVPLASDPRLVGFTGAVVNASTGTLLFDRGASTASPQAGASKVLTGAAAITILGGDTTLATRVYEGSSPKTIVLVGAGDPTLTALESGESVYAGAPRLSTLADKVLDAYDDDIENIVLDASLWSQGDKWDPTWPRSAQTGGTMSEVTALQVDGDRDNPQEQVSPRSTDPVARAGILFARALGLDPDDVTFSIGSAVPSKPLLGEVTSQPVTVLVTQMLQQNDNTLAEHLARLISKKSNSGGSAASISQSITSALAIHAVPATGVVLHDGSGLSTATVLPPKYLAEFMAKVHAGGNELNLVYNSLPVAGKSGTLAARFTGDSAGAKNQVIAIPGASGGHSLAGIILAVDGTPLAFSFAATGEGVKENARAALDALATGAFACGDNLSNN
jgi:serine-type D-Ala-D-Ala carboxypeptidase/endopeptidase (penicillin-binding protein 4)